MTPVIYLAWRYVAFHKIKTTVLVLAVTVTITLPTALSVLMDHYQRRLNFRAESTPMVLGLPGNRFDLIMRALYFRPGRIGPIPFGLTETIRDTDLAEALPIHARYTAKGFPVVGTSVDYFHFRNLELAAGRRFAILGEAVIGNDVAANLQMGQGDTILSDQDNIYNLAKSFPLKMHITGVLAETGGADDRAVFVDIRTAWIIEGLGHGHQDVTEDGNAENKYILDKKNDVVTVNAALPTFTEITGDNIDSFHFHDDIEQLPVSAIIAVPKDQRAATILMNRINTAGEYQALIPTVVIDELMSLVFQVKQFFDANFVLVSMSVLLLLILVVMLSTRLRQGEFDTIHKIGGSRGIIAFMQITELFIIGIAALVIAAMITVLLLLFAPQLGALIW